MQHNIFKVERSIHGALAHWPSVARTGRGPGMAGGALRRGAQILCAKVAGPSVGHPSSAPGFVPARSRYFAAPDHGLAHSETAVADVTPGAADGHFQRAPHHTLYPLRIAARVVAFFGIAALFYALVLVAIFVHSDIVVF